jgi:hypothetical protein
MKYRLIKSPNPVEPGTKKIAITKAVAKEIIERAVNTSKTARVSMRTDKTYKKCLRRLISKEITEEEIEVEEVRVKVKSLKKTEEVVIEKVREKVEENS